MRDFDAFQLVDGPLGAVAMLPAPFYPTAQHMAIGTTDPTVRRRPRAPGWYTPGAANRLRMRAQCPVQQNPTVSVGYIPWVGPSADDGPDSTRIDRGLVLSLTATASHVGEVNGIAVWWPSICRSVNQTRADGAARRRTIDGDLCVP